MSRIPLSAPSFNGNEWKYLKECIDTEWVSTTGKFVERFENEIADFTKSKFAIACVNGTSALQVSLRLAGVKAGDEVIVPTLTFIAPVNAIVYNGASPIFMDADNYYNLSSEKTIDFIKNETTFKNGYSYNNLTGSRVSAILPVHVWGNPVFLDELHPLCIERNIKLIEDASESLGSKYSKGTYKGKHTGTVGKIGCISFNGNKIITTGGGGVMLTDDPKIADKAKYLTKQAKDDPIRYVHNDIGYNFRLTNIQAALGVAQLEQLQNILFLKKQIFKKYFDFLSDCDGLVIDNGPDYSENNHWLNIIKINKNVFGETPLELMHRLEEKGIQTRPVWTLNHIQKPYKNFQNYKIEKAKHLQENSLCLPSSSSLSKKDIKFLAQQILK